MTFREDFLGAPLALRAEAVGGDLLVLCTGGASPHLGGCALAVPYRRETGLVSAAVSCLSAPGHQDAVLASALAGRLCRRLARTVCVQCGIHYDHLSPEELERLQKAVLALGDRLEVEAL